MKINSTKSVQAHVREAYVPNKLNAAQALLDSIAQLGDGAFGESGIAHSWPMQLKAVVSRVQRIGCLDTLGQALAMQAYMIGIATGLYGAQSAIVEGLKENYEPISNAYGRSSGRAAHRIFEALMAAGELEGRDRACQLRSDTSQRVDYAYQAAAPLSAFALMSSSYH